MASILDEIFGITIGGQQGQTADMDSPYMREAMLKQLREKLAGINAQTGAGPTDVVVSTPERADINMTTEVVEPRRQAAAVPYSPPQQPQQAPAAAPAQQTPQEPQRRPTAAELFQPTDSGPNILERVLGTLLAAPGDTSWLPGGERDTKARTNTATQRALVSRGISPEIAQAATLNPQIMAQIAPILFGQKQNAEFKQIGVDQYGSPQYGWINANTQTITPASATVAGPNGERQAPAPAGPDMNLNGAEFLATLPEADRALVQGMIEGRVAPTGNARNPRTQRLMAWAAQVEPGFDFTKWTARNTMSRSTGGSAPNTMGGNITALNTAMAHAESLLKAGENLGNNINVPGATLAREYIGNPIARNAQGLSDFDAREGAFNTTRKALMDEVAKVFAGSQSALADRRAWEEKLTSASSPAQLNGVVRQLAELLKGRIQAQADQYNSVMGSQRDPYSFMSPKAAASMRRLLGEEEEGK